MSQGSNKKTSLKDDLTWLDAEISSYGRSLRTKKFNDASVLALLIIKRICHIQGSNCLRTSKDCSKDKETK